MGEAEDEKVDDRTTAAAEGLKKLLDVLAPEPKAAETPATFTNPVDELYGAISGSDVNNSAVQAANAVERYRNAMRWLVGAVAAIGVALFGSTAFTDGNPFDTLKGWFGLGLAACGLILILVAATLVFEPEDASLGELHDDFKLANNRQRGWWSLHPRWVAINRLKRILEGTEAQAHLGPGRCTVKALIEGINQSECHRIERAKRVSAARRRIDQRTKERAIASTSLKELIEARGAAKDAPDSIGRRLNSAIAEAAAKSAEAAMKERIALHRLTQAQEQLAEVDYQLGVDMLHRALILDESGVAQLRGTFRMSRVFLLAGAFLTLTGALLYVTAVKDKAAANETPVVLRAGTLVVAGGTPSSDEFPAKCVGQPLQVVLLAKDTPALTDEFDVTVSAPEECADTYTIPAGRGDQDVVLDLAPPVEIPLEER